MTTVALLVALLALGYAFLTRRNLQELTRRVSRASSHVFELSGQLEELAGQMEMQRKEFSLAIMQATGQLDFHPQTTIAELQERHPFADDILAGFHMGGCHSCAVEPHETIAEATARLGVNQAALLAALRNGSGPDLVLDLAMHPGNGAAEGHAPRPNVELHF